MAKKKPKVRAVCPDCERVVEKETEFKAWDVVDKHNEQRHDGEEVAGIPKDDVMSAGEMLDTARENMDSEDFLNLLIMMGERDPAGVRE